MFDRTIRALVVENDAHHLVVISTLFDQLGIEYKRNTTGSGVPEQAAAMQPPPDFIMIDLDLPVPDVLAIARSVRAEASLAAVVLLAIGDETWASRAAAIQAAGFAGFIAKPLPSRQLGTLLQRLLSGETLW